MRFAIVVLLAVGSAARAEPNCKPSCYHSEKPASKDGPPCGKADDNLVCEASGSNTALALNIIHFRLDEARKAQKAGKKDVCRDASQVAAATSQGVTKYRTAQKVKKEWSDGLVYQTRAGTLPEAKAFEFVDKSLKEATKLFKACGGKELKTDEVQEREFLDGVED